MARPYVHARLPRSGLGNKLFVWARALVFARRHGLPLVVTGWCTPRWRALLKGGDARLYWNFFSAWNELPASERSRAKVLHEPGLNEPLQSDVTVYEFSQMPHWKNYFADLHDYRALIRREFYSHLTAARRREVATMSNPMVCLQIRLGDFRHLRADEQFSKVGGVRTPLEYFHQWIEKLRSVHGSALPVTLVSDGSATELASLLALPHVSHTPGRTGIADLILMANSRLLVCSAGSTFSHWAGFLGDPVLIHHPEHMHDFCRPAMDRKHLFEGAASPDEIDSWPPLLRANVKSLGNETAVPLSSLKSRLHVLHLPYVYYPDPSGGTEVYVAALCRELAAAGVLNTIAAPGSSDATYVHEGLSVRRFGIDPVPSFETIRVEGDTVAAHSFVRVLDEVKPDIVHFHANSPAISVLLANEVRKRGIATIYTYHTPTGSCHRGTMMRWGTEPCDGRLTSTRCAACQLHHLGVPKLVAQALAMTSWATHTLASCFPQKARWQIPLRASKLAQTRYRTIHEWWAGMDRIVALCAWTERLLEANGVPRHQIRKVRHGLTQASPTAEAKHHSHSTGPVKLVFLGRLDPTKGLHLLLDALDLAPELKLQVDVHTIIEGAPGAYARTLQQRLQTHPKIRVCAPVPSSEVISTLRDASALVVPSTWFETGPLVVLEAFAAGIPVVGSGFGGIAEWVTDGVDGLLVRDLKPESWAAALRRLVAEPGLLAQLTAGVKAPRDMTAVAHEMLEIYQELTAERSLHARVASAPATA